MDQFFNIGFEVCAIALPIAILAFFIWRRGLKKKGIEKLSIRSFILSIYSVIVSVITISIVYVVIVLCTVFIKNYYPDRDFDREVWFSNKEIRYEYSASLKNKELLKGKTREEVIEYLGEADHIEQNAFIYYIGFKPQIMGIDPDWLKITFEGNIVSEIVEYNS